MDKNSSILLIKDVVGRIGLSTQKAQHISPPLGQFTQSLPESNCYRD
jgi:hypothetical protein